MRVIKRDGSIVVYDSRKVMDAIAAAMRETEGFVDATCIEEIEEGIWREVSIKEEIGDLMHVEEIQDTIEYGLMSKYPSIAKAYILYREMKAQERNKEWVMTELQKDIYNSKYRYNGESFNEFIQRVSGGNTDVARIIRDKDFSFGGRILAGRGIDRNVSLSNCYVLPSPEDNLESIFDTAKYAARTYSYGGGVGFDLSNLRPAGSHVNNASEVAAGPITFMQLYDTTTRIISQEGRRGALMLSLSSKHPDVKEFIKSKKDIEELNHANISVRMEDPIDKDIIRDMASHAWETGEPGILFWDRIMEWHLLSHHPEYVISGVNPCAEQSLPDFGSCNLGSINLSNFVIDPFTDNARFDYDRLKEVTRIAVIGLNEALDDGLDLHPLKEQREVVSNFRQIGLGMMGLADAFIKLGIEYGSTQSLIAAKSMGIIIRDEAIRASVDLVDKYGVYPEYDFDIISKSNYFKSLPSNIQELIEEKGMANSHLLSIAPTGSISTLFGVSGGIEPIFANSYTRTTKTISSEGDRHYKVYTKVIEDLMDTLDIEKEKDLPGYCITSHDIEPLDRIAMQSVWQHYIDTGISSTINLKEESTVEDIENIYNSAHQNKLKGITVFRDNCLRVGILNKEETKDKSVCPQCDADLSMVEGCSTCPECGWGACSI